MKHTCKICGKEYDYCHSCSITKDPFKNSGYCGENCYNISMLIQSYRSNVTSVEDAAQKLKEYGVDTMEIVPGVKTYVNEIKEKTTPKVEPVVEEVLVEETPIVEKTIIEQKPFYFNKRNKNKYKVEESLTNKENTSSFINDKDTELLSE